MRKILSTVAAVARGMLSSAWWPTHRHKRGSDSASACSRIRTGRSSAWSCVTRSSRSRSAGSSWSWRRGQGRKRHRHPGDLLSIMDQWNAVGPKIKQIVAQVGLTLEAKRPAYVYDFKAVDAWRRSFREWRSMVLQLPACARDAAARRGAKVPPSMPGVWERAANDDRPHEPRLFLIPTTPEVFIGDGDPVINWHADRRKDYDASVSCSALSADRCAACRLTR